MSALNRTLRTARIQSQLSPLHARLLSTSRIVLGPSEQGAPVKKSKIQTWFLPQPSSSTKPSSQEEELDAPLPLFCAPLPANAPEALQKFHAFLIETAPSEAHEVILPETLQFFDARSSPATLQAFDDPESSLRAGRNASSGSGEEVRLSSRELRRKWESDLVFPDGDAIQGEEDVGPAWEWIGVVQVRGRGRGIVGRADGVIRRWLLKNPVSPGVPAVKLEYPKTPKIDPDADWSIVPVKGTRVCLNLVTEEGRRRWSLEDLWGGPSLSR